MRKFIYPSTQRQHRRRSPSVIHIQPKFSMWQASRQRGKRLVVGKASVRARKDAAMGGKSGPAMCAAIPRNPGVQASCHCPARPAGGCPSEALGSGCQSQHARRFHRAGRGARSLLRPHCPGATAKPCARATQQRRVTCQESVQRQARGRVQTDDCNVVEDEHVRRNGAVLVEPPRLRVAWARQSWI